MAKIKVRVIDAYVYRKTKKGILYLIFKKSEDKNIRAPLAGCCR